MQTELEARGIKRLVITWGQTQYCVDTTVRRAVAQGYDVLLASVAHTTGCEQGAFLTQKLA